MGNDNVLYARLFDEIKERTAPLAKTFKVASDLIATIGAIHPEIYVRKTIPADPVAEKEGSESEKEGSESEEDGSDSAEEGAVVDDDES